MLLSEMFGVERDTDFGVKGYSVIFKISTFLGKYEYLMYKWSAALDWREAEGTMLCNVIGGAPENIVHLPPPLTDEQREQLRALCTLGYRSLVKDKYGSVYAYEIKPCKKTRDTWPYEDGDSHLCCTKPTKCLESLVSWSDPEPFDIGKALGVGE